MKTTITSNGKQVDVILEAENPLETAITNAIDLFKQNVTVSRPEDGKLALHINTERVC